jgi:predicted site-specific integrase-resolvase
MKMLKVKEVSEMTGLHPSTLRELHKRGSLVPKKVSEGGTRYYSEEQILDYLGIEDKKRKVIGYCRVSGQKQAGDLERQVDRLQAYMAAKGYQFEIIEDVGSGIKYDKKGLQELIKRIDNNEVSKVVIMYKDRLVRFGYELLEYICKLHGTTIEVVDTTEKTEQEELTEDLVQIVTVFACRLQGRRAKKTKEIIKELTKNDNNEKN